MSGGRTAAARRRKRRAEGAVAAAHGVLAAEVRERREERAKVLRVVVRQVIAELREQADLKQRRCDHREAQIAAAVVKKAEAARNQRTKPVATQYQQRITIDALLVEGQGDELLIGDDWMVERQVKMDFGSRELKYLDVTGQKVILPFTCHGVSTLQQAGQERRAVVRLTKTVKLATNTRSVVQMKVDAEDGTTGVFLPKPTSKRHLLIAPTVDTVKDGMVSVVVLNVDGQREKLPAREALGTWIPTDADMEILSLNGELESDRVAKWVAALKKGDARPLQDEDKLDIGDMEAADKDLVIALLRQYAGIVEKKPGCPPLAKA
ncbi:hypothetical protein PF001_g29500 [Phytophthora fragariae]|uniref:Uncharacterized protein n=1 Tax=Phytophthora fragariae TaxID=53985 RepID=A0A6A4B6G9_9STRA|nr:hypothetical protein PF001_g29500 [Phytophthora fragariae]